MNSKRYAVLVAFAAVLSLTSCSGVKKACTVNCGGGSGTATLVLTMRATPLTPPASTNLLAFVTTLTGIALNPGSGSAFGIASTPTVDFVRLQSDSFFLATSVSVPAGNYTSLTITFSAPTVTYCTQLAPGTPGCAANSVTTLTGGAVSVAQIPVTLSLAANQKAALEIDLNTATAISVANQVVTSANLGAANAFTATLLPPAASSLATGQVDFFDNILGVVSAVSPQQITVATSENGAYFATRTASTFYSPNCALTPGTACPPAVGQLVSIDTAINPDGTFTLLSYDPLSSVAINWVEGVVTFAPTTATQFQIIAGDQATVQAVPSALPTGTIVNVTLNNPSPFVVDSKGITTLPANSFVGSLTATSLVPGMTVAIDVKSFTPAAGSTPAAITADLVMLRDSVASGLIASTAPPGTFAIQSLPPFFGQVVNFNVQLQTLAPLTNFDGVTDATGLVTGHTVALSGLYFGPGTTTPFVATKVRAF